MDRFVDLEAVQEEREVGDLGHWSPECVVSIRGKQLKGEFLQLTFFTVVQVVHVSIGNTVST